jgi:hypothetical protein
MNVKSNEIKSPIQFSVTEEERALLEDLRVKHGVKSKNLVARMLMRQALQKPSFEIGLSESMQVLQVIRHLIHNNLLQFINSLTPEDLAAIKRDEDE